MGARHALSQHRADRVPSGRLLRQFGVPVSGRVPITGRHVERHLSRALPAGNVSVLCGFGTPPHHIHWKAAESDRRRLPSGVAELAGGIMGQACGAMLVVTVTAIPVGQFPWIDVGEKLIGGRLWKSKSGYVS